MKKLICKIFGHRWIRTLPDDYTLFHCTRCNLFHYSPDFMGMARFTQEEGPTIKPGEGFSVSFTVNR